MPGRSNAFRKDEGGNAIIEFALLLPLMMVAYLGFMEVARMVETSRKVTLYARTIADLSGRATNGAPTVTDMNAIVSASGAIMRPYPTDKMSVSIHAMGVENVYGALYGGTCSSFPRNVRPVLTINGTNGLPATPATYNYDGSRYILAEVSLPYTPILGSDLFKSIFGPDVFRFSRQISWAQRLDKGEVVMPQGAKCPTY